MSSLFRNSKDFSYGTAIRKVGGIILYIMLVLGIEIIVYSLKKGFIG